MDLAISNATLPNGLRVVLVRDPRAHDIQVTMRYAAGDVDDPPGQEGIAHLVEHLMFQQIVGSESIFAKLEAQAHWFNAFTSHDATTYITRAAPAQLASLLAIEGVRFGFRCTSITPAAFEREREVVVNELRLRERGTALHDALERGVFSASHPYARSSTPASVGAVTMEQACAFADAHYTPTNAVLVVSGNLDEQQVITAMGKLIAKLPKRTAAPALAIPVAPHRASEATAPLDEDAVVVAWPVPGDPVRRALAHAMWGTVASEIDAHVKGLVLPLTLGDTHAEMLGLLIYRTDKETAADVTEAVKAAVASAPKELELGGRFGKLVFNRLQQRALYDTFASFEDGSGRDVRIASDVLAGREPESVLSNQLRGLGELSASGAAALVRELFAFQRATVVAITAETETRGGDRHELAAPIHDIGRHRDVDDPADAHQPAPEPLPSAPEPIVRQLPNGLRVVLLPVTSVPTVDARLVFRAGSADEPADKRGAASVAAYALAWRGSALNEAVALIESGGSTEADVSPDRVVFSAHGLDMHLDYLLAGLRKRVVDGGYGRSAAALVRALHGHKHVDDEATLTDAFQAARYGEGHPYVDARATWRHASATLSLDDARAFRAHYFTPDNATLIIAGRFDTALAIRWIDHLFADWHGTAAPRVSPPAHVQPVSIAKEDAIAQIQITMALPATGGARAERLIAAAMLDDIVSDVRHQLGAAYVFDAAYREQRLAASYDVGGATDAPRTAEAIALVRDRLAQLHTDPDATARAFIAARRHVLSSLGASSGRAEALADAVTVDLSLGRAPLSDARLAAEVQMTTIERMPAALADLDLARAAILMRGPTADVDRAFAVLGRTPQHLPATDTSDDDSPFDDDVLAAQRQRMDLDAPAAPSRGTAALLPGYAFGSLRGQTVSGPVLSGLVGLHIERHVTANLMLSIGDLSSDSGAEVTPVVGAVAFHVDFGRVWAGGLLGYRIENAIHPDIIGSRWYDSFEAGVEAGVVALHSGRHQLAAFARYENASGSEIGLSPFTLGVGYRFY